VPHAQHRLQGQLTLFQIFNDLAVPFQQIHFSFSFVLFKRKTGAAPLASHLRQFGVDRHLFVGRITNVFNVVFHPQQIRGQQSSQLKGEEKNTGGKKNTGEERTV